MQNNNSLSSDYLQRHFRYEESWQRARDVPGADAESYRLLNHAWAVDRRYVYFEGKPLKRADPRTFTVLNELYARDASGLFCKAGNVSAIVDPATFEVLDSGWYESSFGHIVYAGYARDRNHVYFAKAYGEPPRIVRGADAATFVSLGSAYGRDSRQVYLETATIRDALPASFELLNALYSRDARHVYYLGNRVAGAVASEFTLIDERHGRDNQRVYETGQVIEQADPVTYQLLDGIYVARDRQHVWVANQLQPHIDIASFEFLGFDYFADHAGVYWQGKLIAGADRASFVAEAYGKARDKTHKYWQNNIQGTRGDARQSMSLTSRIEGPSLLGTIASALWDSFADLFPRRSSTETVEDSPPPREPDMRMLAQTLAMGDDEALAPVLLAIEDPEAFVAEYSGRGSFADEPDYDSIIEECEDDSEELHPFTVLQEVYHTRGLLGIIDWRSGSEETIAQVEPMLHRFGIRDFDWSFIDVLLERGDGTEMKNQNFLTLLRDCLQPLGLTLVHVNLLCDSYGFVVLRAEDYRKIAGYEDPDHFLISTEFGADESYERGKRILAGEDPRG